jgi:hypothetical protein
LDGITTIGNIPRVRNAGPSYLTESRRCSTRSAARQEELTPRPSDFSRSRRNRPILHGWIYRSWGCCPCQRMRRQCLLLPRTTTSSGSRHKVLFSARSGRPLTNRLNCTCTPRAATASECDNGTFLRITGSRCFLSGSNWKVFCQSDEYASQMQWTSAAGQTTAHSLENAMDDEDG